MTMNQLTTDRHLDRIIDTLGISNISAPHEIGEIMGHCFGSHNLQFVIEELRPNRPNFLEGFYYALLLRIFSRFETRTGLTFGEWVETHELQLNQEKEINNEPTTVGSGNTNRAVFCSV